MLAAYNQVGISFPHNAAAQRGLMRSVSRTELQPGDFVFYRADLSHVACTPVTGGWCTHRTPRSRCG